MARLIDLTDQKFNKLTVVGRGDKPEDSQQTCAYWLCRCDCGNEKTASSTELRRGGVKSCGCLYPGRKRNSAYGSWQAMKARCLNSNHKNYESYGARGIQVCERWRNSFESFLEDMGERPTPKHSIERINNSGHYEPDNCRWATQAEQRRNQSNNRVLTFQGKTQCLQDWAQEAGISRQAIYRRLERGWSVERALTVATVIAHNQHGAR